MEAAFQDLQSALEAHADAAEAGALVAERAGAEVLAMSTGSQERKADTALDLNALEEDASHEQVEQAMNRSAQRQRLIGENYGPVTTIRPTPRVPGQWTAIGYTSVGRSAYMDATMAAARAASPRQESAHSRLYRTPRWQRTPPPPPPAAVDGVSAEAEHLEAVRLVRREMEHQAKCFQEEVAILQQQLSQRTHELRSVTHERDALLATISAPVAQKPKKDEEPVRPAGRADAYVN